MATSALAALVLALGAAGCDDDDEDEPRMVTVHETQPADAPAHGGADAQKGQADGGDCTPIVVDPGHDARGNPATEPIGPGSSTRKIKDGGGTRGVSTGTPEHEVTLDVSLELREVLEDEGYCVTMTRTRSAGRSMGNVARARIGNRAKAALSVRVHADGSPDRSRNGSFVLYPALRRGWTGDILPESRRAARLVQRELVSGLGSRDLGIQRRSDITGFNWSNVPVILVELGYLTNPREDRLLNTPSYQRKAARGIARGIERFTSP